MEPREKFPAPQLRCPICDKPFPTDKPDIVLPFCSKRCKVIDRARWLGEEYGMPYETENDAPDEPHESAGDLR